MNWLAVVFLLRGIAIGLSIAAPIKLLSLELKTIKIITADSNELISKTKELFREYASSLGFDLSFQDFEQEITIFPEQYSPPQGRLCLAQCRDEIVGCVGLRDLDGGRCEMKRMYVKPNYRGQGLGKALG